MHLIHRWWTHPTDYTWTAQYQRADQLLHHLPRARGLWCWLYSALCVLSVFTPVGVVDDVWRVVVLVLGGIAGVIGLWWIRVSEVSEAASRLFVAFLDLSAAAVLLMVHEPLAALPFAAAFGVNGAYIAGFHSPKMFVAHQVWSAAVVAVLFIRAVGATDADVILAVAYLVLLTLVLFSAPVATHVLLLRLRRDAAAAFFDSLTGLRNRRGLESALAEDRYMSETVSVLVIDLDAFKSVNDRFGHAHGDIVLRSSAQAINDAFVPPAITARTGGEEFVVVTAGDPSEVIDRAIALLGWFAAQPAGVGVTISIGVAHDDAGDLARTFAHVLDRADSAMYAAKHAGGNTLRVAETGSAHVDY
ncbi:GGDEF domain-containing protein [Rhodococcoides fascians]|uniref:GGDEF domain-containing protein n=1 Tax=Rhodococcoides fascians TaxID=1828 RepID=UPI00055F7164|nr:GGDEF domain-containing protein [Rhodococcus fascians]